MHFNDKSIDPFEPDSRLQPVVLETCRQCHSSRGIFSVNSYTRFLSASARGPASFSEDTAGNDQAEALYWKQRQYDWGLLQGLWRNGGGL